MSQQFNKLQSINQTMSINLTQDGKDQLRSYTLQKMEVMVDMFRNIIRIDDPQKWTDDDWILFSCFALNTLATQFVQREKDTSNLLNTQHILRKVLKDERVEFLIRWFTDNQTYKDHNFKDRKNSFFRLINKELKKRIKGKSEAKEAKEAIILKRMQEGLNHNTISNKQIKQFEDLWSEEICDYLESSEILQDITIKNKSKGSRHYYILHLSQIKHYASLNKLSEFPFYEKANIEVSFCRIIRTLCELQHQQKELETMDCYDGSYQSQFQRNGLIESFEGTSTFARTEDDNLFSVLNLDTLDPGQKDTWVQKSMTFLPNI